jgi:hypothetical protein
MIQSRWTIALGAIGLFVLTCVALAALAATLGTYDVAADAPHTALLRNFIGFARDRSIEERARPIVVPQLGDPHMIAEGVEHYDAMCTGCHLAPGMAENEMRPGMNPKPPILAQAPRRNPAEQFWIIKHGIKMTGMPAWGVTHTDGEIWNMVALLQVLPKLSPAQYKALAAQSAGHHEHEDRDMDHMNMPH